MFTEDLTQLLPSPMSSNRCYGVTIGIVTNTQDKAKLGRVKIKLPLVSDRDETDWVRVLTPLAGAEQGLYCLPEVNDEVLVAFEQGDPQRPYVLGALWNAKAKPPQTTVAQRQIVSRSGHTILLDDTEGKEKIKISDGGNNHIIITSQDNSLLIETEGNITIKAKGTLTLSGKGVDIDAQGKPVNVKASKMEVQ